MLTIYQFNYSRSHSLRCFFPKNFFLFSSCTFIFWQRRRLITVKEGDTVNGARESEREAAKTNGKQLKLISYLWKSLCFSSYKIKRNETWILFNDVCARDGDKKTLFLWSSSNSLFGYEENEYKRAKWTWNIQWDRDQYGVQFMCG